MITETYCGRTDGPHPPHGWSILPRLHHCPGRPVRLVKDVGPILPLEFRQQANRLAQRYCRAEVVVA